MGLLDQLGALLGRSREGGSPSLSALITEVLGNEESGGLQGLVQKFQAAGLGDIVNSWIGTGSNEPVSPDQVHDALGHEQVESLANRAGVPVDTLLTQLSQHLPGLIDKLTPQGQIPQGGALQAALNALGRKPTSA
jgi:uncharacterized protein YidB (DUF937 family)